MRGQPRGAHPLHLNIALAAPPLSLYMQAGQSGCFCCPGQQASEGRAPPDPLPLPHTCRQGSLAASAARGSKRQRVAHHLRSGALHAAKRRLREMQQERDRQRGKKVGGWGIRPMSCTR